MDSRTVERAEDALLGSMAKSNGDKSDYLLNLSGTSPKLGSSSQSTATFIENESLYGFPKTSDVQDAAVPPVTTPKSTIEERTNVPDDVESLETDRLVSHGGGAASAQVYQATGDFSDKELSGNKTEIIVGETEGDPKGVHKTDESKGQSNEDFLLHKVQSEGSSEGKDNVKLGGSDVLSKSVGDEEEGNVVGASIEELNISGGTAKESSADNASNETSEKDQNAKDDDDEWEDILGSGQIKKKIVKKAENGYRPGQNSICEINLVGRLEDGTEVERFENLRLDLGDVEVIQGIDLALPLMEVGEIALVEIGPRFAYGTMGKEPEIPSNARMFYSVELLSAEDTPELETLPISKRKDIGSRKRERGNWWFARQEYNFAIHCYRRAIEYLDDVTEGFSSDNREEGQNIDDELQDLLESRLKVYNNLAAAQMKIKVYDAALTSVENVLRCQPQNVKALFRKGKILAAKGDTASAVNVLTAAKKLEPDNSVIKQELMHYMLLLKQDTNQEKNLYKKMLGQDKQQPESVSKSQSKSRGITWGLVCGSIVAVLVGALAFRYKFP